MLKTLPFEELCEACRLRNAGPTEKFRTKDGRRVILHEVSTATNSCFLAQRSFPGREKVIDALISRRTTPALPAASSTSPSFS